MSAPGRERRAGPRRKRFSSLQGFTLLDANRALRALALDLASGSARLRDLNYRHGEARTALADAEPADLVVASYVIGEIGDADPDMVDGPARFRSAVRDRLDAVAIRIEQKRPVIVVAVLGAQPRGAVVLVTRVPAHPPELVDDVA